MPNAFKAYVMSGHRLSSVPHQKIWRAQMQIPDKHRELLAQRIVHLVDGECRHRPVVVVALRKRSGETNNARNVRSRR